MLRDIRHFARLAGIARTLARHDALFPLELLEGMPFLKRSLHLLGLISRRKADEEGTPGERLTLALQSLGPSFIKMGQGMATRPDLIGEQVADDLTALQDRLPPFSGAEARRTIESELGAPVEALFSDFDDQPIAAASIAQVHRATTSDGRAVAVKVLRPKIEQAFESDLKTFFWAAHLIERNVPEAKRLKPVEVITSMAETIALEMDLRMEAAAASELRENTMEDAGFRVPEIDWPRTGKRVMTSEWIDGIPINNHAEIVAAGHDTKMLAAHLIRNLLLQVMRDGFFHADLHQGNLFIDEDSNIVAVDFGIMGRLDRPARRYLAETLRGFHTGDFRRIAEVHFEAGYVPRHKSVASFAQALRAIGEPIAGRPVKDISFGKLLAQLFQTTSNFEMETQPDLLLLQKSMVMLEGLSLQMDPDINMWDVSPPIIKAWAASNMGVDARAREGIEAALSLVRYLPLLAREAEKRIESFGQSGVKLDPETVRTLAEADRRPRRIQNILLATIAALLLALVLTVA